MRYKGTIFYWSFCIYRFFSQRCEVKEIVIGFKPRW